MEALYFLSSIYLGINKSNGRWVVHFHAPCLLSEYVQEVGRGGRDRQRADALTLVSEPTGWLDPDDKGRRQYFQDQERKQRQVAQRLIKQIPTQGDVHTVTRQFKQGAIALSLLHSTGQLEWQDPFHYVLNRSVVPNTLSQDDATRQMTQFLRTRGCRWQYIFWKPLGLDGRLSLS